MSYAPTAVSRFNNTTLSAFGMIDAGVGYRFNSWFRMDGTLEYRGGADLQSLYTLPIPSRPPSAASCDTPISTAPTFPRSWASSTDTSNSEPIGA